MIFNEAISHILDLSDDAENKVLSGGESDHILDDSTFESSTSSTSQEYTGNGGYNEKSVRLFSNNCSRLIQVTIYKVLEY